MLFYYFILSYPATNFIWVGENECRGVVKTLPITFLKLKGSQKVITGFI